MGTLTLAGIRNLIRSDLNESSTTTLLDTELNSLINDGQKDTTTKGLCYEKKIVKTDIPASVRIIPLIADNVIRVNYVEYDLGAAGGKGMLAILPQAVGYASTSGSGNTPQLWFQWGNCLVIEPPPDVATYDLNIYAACYPAAVMSADADTPASLPVEFHECVYQFALAFAALKLKRWADAGNAYNRYIANVQRKRFEYIMKFPESKLLHELPDNVTMEAQREQ